MQHILKVQIFLVKHSYQLKRNVHDLSYVNAKIRIEKNIQNEQCDSQKQRKTRFQSGLFVNM